MREVQPCGIPNGTVSKARSCVCVCVCMNVSRKMISQLVKHNNYINCK